MELKPGYKQTEVGVIPEDWEVANIGDFSSIKTGPFGTVLRADEYSESDGVPLISVGEIGIGRIKVTKRTPLIPRKVVLRLPQYVLRTGDIVFGRKGAVERSALVTFDEDGWFLGSDGIRIRPTSMVHPPYLVAQFHSTATQAWLANNAIGTTMASLNQQILRCVCIPLPPLPEQKAIAKALSDMDSLLSGLDSLIAKKHDIKQATMQQLLTGKTRLPGFSGEWEVKRLGDVGKCIRGVSYKGDTDLSQSDGDYTKRLLRSNNVQNSAVVTQDLQYVIASRVSAHQILQADDVLICMANGSKVLVGKAAKFILDDGFEYTFGAFMGCFRTTATDVDKSYVFYHFLTERYSQLISVLLAGSSINNLTPSTIESFEIPFPPLPEQLAIAKVLTDMDAELEALEQRRDKTRELKQAMMQELLTGRTRLV